jgi:hypothetical protein
MENTAAHTSHVPIKNVKLTYIDIMPLLMVGPHVNSWPIFLNKFRSLIVRFLGICDKVVLGVDCYDLVSEAKGITQANRAKIAVPVVFEGHSLPSVFPSNFNDMIRNRCFKALVIEAICDFLPTNIGLEGNKALIIDYKGCPAMCMKVGGSVTIEYMEDMPPMGEADVKFVRWMRIYGNAIVHSVDGDLLMIALLEYERQVRTRVDVTIAPPIAILYRLKCHDLDDDPLPKKRKGEVAGPIVEKKQNAREMEYINVPLIYHSMCEALRQCSGVGGGFNQHEKHYMEMLSCLVALTGTDFTRNIPLIGVDKLWELMAIKEVWNGFTMAFDVETGSLCVDKACDSFIARLYCHKFPKHARGNTLTGVLTTLKSKLGKRSVELLPSEARMQVTIKNTNWLLKYWMCTEPLEGPDGQWDYQAACPDPICPEYGFGYRETPSGKRVVVWGDLLE